MIISLGMVLFSLALLVTAWIDFRRPHLFTKWMLWIKSPVHYRICSGAIAATFFVSWLAALSWDGSLVQLLGRYLSIYEIAYPLLLWALLISVQAGLFLWLPGAPEADATAQKSNRIFSVAAVLVPLAVYAVIVWIAIPRSIGEIFRYDLIFLSVPALVVIYFSFQNSGWKAHLVGLGAVLAMAALALSYLWNSGASEEPVVMGIFPYLDPSGYYTDALRILAGQLISNFGGRPLFAGFLSLVLGLTRNNLQLSLAILVAVTSLACYLAARQIALAFGPAAAAFAMLLMFIYYRQFMGTTYTENLGLTLGALGLAFLLQGCRLKNFLLTLSGLFLTSFALNVRPGSFFILPFLVIWFVWLFRRSKSFRSSVGPFLLACLVIALPFLLNYLMDSTLSTPNYEVFSRFPQTFYGLAVGGKNWNQVNVDHPELLKLVDPQLSNTIYELAFTQIRSNPARFLIGLWKTAKDLFTVQYGAFTIIYGDLKIRLGLFLLSLLGLVFLFARPKNMLHGLLLACLLGIVLSSPFVPAHDSNRMRTYAAVIPFIVLIPALCFSLPNLRSKTEVFQKVEPNEKSYSSFGFIFTAGLVLCVIAGPYLTKALSQKPVFQVSDCSAPDQAYFIRINPDSYVKIIDDNQQKTHLPDLRLGDLKASINNFAYRHVFNQQPYQAGTIITVTIDLQTGKKIWADIPAAGLPLDGSIVKICGKSVPQYYSIYADSYSVVGK
ncbi:MAG: hypothetical protein P4L50_12210 [Anaerolineaceae bacterium]|nr:hypothetical protein [Anaerolineaceae bacterium]